ncbi:ribosomal silencing factor RsfS [Furfurilactobacillus siliginis]|uniref:Ribosomal silencing factor RsfS n=1 Tax=Furfurilactobacillus siliginis TaxID=348151 RepID=A0A510VN66_9LACO|nr:ribosomal silencing factor RsfS [Furfurilactobacillus siliginis]
MDSKAMLETAVKAGDSKRAEDIVALDVEQVSLVADYFVIMNGGSKRQVQAIAQAVLDEEAEAGVDVRRIEGKTEGTWVLLDFGDILVHIFQEEQRHYYNLEKLWSDAPLVDIDAWVSENV